MKPPKKTNVERILEAAGLPYVPHAFDGRGGQAEAAEIAAQLGIPPSIVFKTLVTETERHEAFVFVIPADGRLDLKKAAKAAGVKALSMLPLAKLFPLTGYRHGGCSPLGMKRRLPTFIDASAEALPELYVCGGQIGLNVSLAPKPLAALIPAPFVPLTQ